MQETAQRYNAETAEPCAWFLLAQLETNWFQGFSTNEGNISIQVLTHLFDAAKFVISKGLFYINIEAVSKYRFILKIYREVKRI